MDRDRFISELETTDKRINNEWIFDVLKQSIDSNLKDGNPRGHRNLIIVMEELADVQLCIYYVQEICKITNNELYKAMNIKMNRLNGVLNKEGEYQ